MGQPIHDKRFQEDYRGRIESRNTDPYRERWIKHQLAAGAAAGGVASIPNPEGRRLAILDSFLVIDTPSAGASTIDVGVAATGATASGTLQDEQSGAAAGIFAARGAGGALPRLWGAAEFVTASQSTGAVAGLKGALFLQVVDVDEA